jgi:hypothetical protein
VFVIAESVMTASLFLALVSQVCASAYEMTAHADRGSDFKTQHVLERNQNTDFGLGFWPKQIRMDSFLVQKPNYGAAFAYCPVRWGTDFVPNSIILVFEYGTVFPWRGGDALIDKLLLTTSTHVL